MEIVSCRSEFADRVDCWKSEGRSIGLVPTMGALHAGHMSLVNQSRVQVERTIATIFVNPTQFAAGEDLGKYPRPFERDIAQLREAGVSLVFTPAAEEMYPVGFSTRVTPPSVAHMLEGEHRPTHFGGVATVVLKLLNLARADVAFFGQKDYQQCLVIQHMVRDLDVPTRIEICPIVRDADGLALSSRNVYLDAQQREQALALVRTLGLAQRQFQSALREQGYCESEPLEQELRNNLLRSGIERVDYACVVDPQTLAAVDRFTAAVCLLAAHVGSTRLIDNCLLGLEPAGGL